VKRRELMSFEKVELIDVVGTVNAHIKTLTGLVPLCNMRMS
jgi:hypothetical protein